MDKNLIYKSLFTIRTDEDDFLIKYDMFIKFLVKNKLNIIQKIIIIIQKIKNHIMKLFFMQIYIKMFLRLIFLNIL